MKEAAEHFNTTVEAIRKRVQRGSLEADKDPDGRVYVWLDVDRMVSPGDSNLALAPLLEAKDETIKLLRQQLEVRDEEIRRRDAILMQMAQSIPALEPSSA